MDIGQIDKSEGEEEDVNAVQQSHPFDRSNQKHKQGSDNERKPFHRRTANSSPSAPRQSTPRDKKPWSDETKQSASKKQRLILLQVWWKGSSCQDKAKEGTSDMSNVKRFFCKEKGHARKDCTKFSAWLAEKKTVGYKHSANSIEEDGWIFALGHKHDELSELIMIDSGASVHVCPPDHCQENGLRKSSGTRPLLTHREQK